MTTSTLRLNVLVVATLTLSGNVICRKYKSLHGQDKFVNERYFKNRCNGVFLEIGAHDGVRESNTWFFEKKLGWKGMCIEPRPSAFKRLTSKRDCICVEGAITPQEGPVQFRVCKGPSEGHWLEFLSGIESEYPPMLKDLMEQKVKQNKGKSELIQVYGYVLNNLLEKHGLYHIDFLSLDTEGGELEILKSIDFEKFFIYVITVENHFDVRYMKAFLESKGFEYVKRVHFDDIYVNKNPYKGNLA